MKKYIFASLIVFTSVGVQSCLDYDDPGSELAANQSRLETTVYHGQPDSIYYLREFTESEVTNAIDTLTKYGYLGQSKTGQYCLRGAKEGNVPQSHAYQRQYSLGPDAYAQYFVVPHKDFMYGTLTSTYDMSDDFNGGPLGSYTMVKNAIVPMLNHPVIDSIPELKAINLLYYCVAAQEMADLSGPYTYSEDKVNSEEPYEYNDLKTIYYGIVENLDTIVNCLKYYENRPAWYKRKVETVLAKYNETTRDMFNGPTGMTTYIKLANSLKLRMAMHVVKVEPQTAKKWAEEAVASGVIESPEEQQGIFPMISGFSHPLLEIANTWGDLRMCASFESLLLSLDHPYTKYLFQKNDNAITNVKTGEVMEAGTRICGIRAGTLVGEGQTYALNQRQAFSTFSNQYMFAAPLYFVKYAEVLFLRAEGSLRGWNMGGTAQEFYERGIENAYVEDPMMPTSTYTEAMSDYMNLERPIDYVSVDPMGEGEDWPSVTKIGVKWNDGDSNEIKLEKIITQKYIALFPLSTEAWAELRRTGYPKLFPVLNPDDGDGSVLPGEMIRRIPWAATDPQIQSMIDNTGIPALRGEDVQSTRLWWDVDAPNF